jgi:hypothetical protein
MVKALAAFVCAAALSAALQIGLSSCGFDDCGCRALPEFPDHQPALSIVDADNFTAMGDVDPLPFDLVGGTMEIVGQQLVIRYVVDGDARETIYDIEPRA